jgi:oligoribonuclease
MNRFARMFKDPLVWIDLEMSGLDIQRDKILEIAVVVTDGKLEQLVHGPQLVIHQSKEILENMDEWCIRTHTNSGLVQEVEKSTVTEREAEQIVMDFLLLHTCPGEVPLAGSSVHVDRQFLQRDMQRITDHLHYRIVDVSSIKELVARWYPKRLRGFGGDHRAAADIMASIAQLKYYRNSVFK